jgi:UDP-N-acetylmuramate dehydrogenase
MRGVVVKLGRGFARIGWDTGFVRAGAAVQLGRLARAAVQRGFAGLEYAEGIPGTVGGAVFMNAGAYGGEVAGAIESVEGVDRRRARCARSRRRRSASATVGPISRPASS